MTKQRVPVYHFESDHGNLIVYHQGEKIAHFSSGKFQTKDRAVAEVLRDAAEWCHEVVTAAAGADASASA